MNAKPGFLNSVAQYDGRFASWRVALDGAGRREPLLTQTVCFTREGFSVQLDQPLPEGEPLTVYLEIPCGERTTTLKIESITAAPASDATSPPFRYELMFGDLSPRQALALDRALVKLDLKAARPSGPH